MKIVNNDKAVQYLIDKIEQLERENERLKIDAQLNFDDVGAMCDLFFLDEFGNIFIGNKKVTGLNHQQQDLILFHSRQKYRKYNVHLEEK